MKKLYTNRIVSAEQFTDDFTPDGVIIADPKIIKKVVIQPYRDQALKNGAFLFKYPKPSDGDNEVAEAIGAPFPFGWIFKGDYVLTSTSGYAWVESQKSFEEDYKEIQVVEP